MDMDGDKKNIEAALGHIGDGPFPPAFGRPEFGLIVSKENQATKSGRIETARHYLDLVTDPAWNVVQPAFYRAWKDGELEAAYRILRRVYDQVV